MLASLLPSLCMQALSVRLHLAVKMMPRHTSHDETLRGMPLGSHILSLSGITTWCRLGHGNADGAIVIEEALLMSFPSGTQNAQPWHVDPSTIQLCERDGRAVVLGDSRLGKVSCSCRAPCRSAVHRQAEAREVTSAEGFS